MEVQAPVAFKLLLQHIFQSQSDGQSLVTESGLRFERVWVQVGGCGGRGAGGGRAVGSGRQ